MSFVGKAVRRAWSAARQPAGFRQLARNVALDLRYGGRLLGGAVRNPDGSRGFHDSENTDYGMLEKIFASVELRPDDCVVDVGCGKGRLMNWLLSRGFEGKVIGVEVNPEVAGFARSRLARYPRIEILTGDATRELPREGSVFYLYNPFNGPLVAAFAELLAKVPARDGKRPLVIYFNPLHLGEFEKQGLWDVRIGGVEPLSRHRVAYLERRR